MASDDLHPFFIGPYGENAQLFEELLVEFVRDHAYWRRNFHPESTPPIPTTAQHTAGYLQFVADLKRELYRLSADLKKSVPFFSPRYVGHMASDLLLPGLLGSLVTTLYNPNNVTEDASPATLRKELEVGQQLAAMVGYESAGGWRPWGHLTSGGTVANYTALRNFTAVKFYPLALAATLSDFALESPAATALRGLSDWELFNLGIDRAVEARTEVLREARALLDDGDFASFVAAVDAARIERLGLVGFSRQHPTLAEPVVFVSKAGHYSWEKAMKLLGFGTTNLVVLEVDQHMRLDVDHLAAELERCSASRRPVLALVAILGNTEFGTVDPLGEMVAVRDEAYANGLDAPLHVDAAWGGYLATMFRKREGGLESREAMRSMFRYFPTDAVYDAFGALPRSESITIDPHKLGYIPYAAGAYVARNDGVIDFLTQSAAYVFGTETADEPRDAAMRKLGQYILEGSKPGAAAAAVHLTHSVLPLHGEGFGRILEGTIHACEYFYDAVDGFAETMRDRVAVTIPVEPDTNLACLAVNPRGNRELAVMNRFGRRVFERLAIDPDLPVQNREFIASQTSLLASRLSAPHAEQVLAPLGVDPSTFVRAPRDRAREADHIFLLRHTLMNPWLLFEERGANYIDRYLAALGRVIDDVLAGFGGAAGG